MGQVNQSRTRQSSAKPSDLSTKELQTVSAKLDDVTTRLDAVLSLLLDLLLSDPKLQKSVPYTDKVARLGELGFELNMISRVVRRPSNYVSSRLRESKKRGFSRRQQRLARPSDLPSNEPVDSSGSV